MESTYQDLKKDLVDAHSSFLLIEIQDKHAQQIQLEYKGYSLEKEAIGVFDNNALQGTTNVVIVNPEEGIQAQILNTLYSLISDDLKAQKSLDSAIKFGIYASTLGLSDLVSDSMASSITDFLSETVTMVGEKVSTAFGDTATNTLFSETENVTVKLAEKITRASTVISKLYISPAGQRRLLELAEQLSSVHTPHEAMTFTINLLSALGIDAPKCIIINDPFSLDAASLSLCSLLVSHATDARLKGGTLPLSIVLNYTKRQPYNVEEEATPTFTNLLRLRHMAQRYSLLEKPGTRIPTPAIKSTTFVGRKKELESLLAQRRVLIDLINAQPDTPFHQWTIIEGEPGTGKTALVNRHLASLDNYEDVVTSGQIHLRILNQIGHNSNHTGLSSLLTSAEAEANRLKQYYQANTHFFKRTLNEKVENVREIKEDFEAIVTTRDFSFSKVRSLAKSAVSMTNYGTLFSAVSSLFDRAAMDKSNEQTIEALMDSGAQNAKVRMFEQLDKVIARLRRISTAIDNKLFKMPVLLFVDDLQWIDEYTAEYILTRVIGLYPVQLLLTSRGADCQSAIKQAMQIPQQNRYKITLFSLCNLCNSPFNEVNEILRQYMTLNPKIVIKGMDNTTFTQLVNTVYGNPNNIDTERLSKALINELQENKGKRHHVNTLFAVEALNLLSDIGFYKRADNLVPIFSKANNDAYLIVVPEDADIEGIIKRTFAHLSQIHAGAYSADRMATNVRNEFTLASFAVMEERLFIIREYFADYGDLAIFTLQLASLFGTPFNSNIVSEVLKLLGQITEKDAPQFIPLLNFVKTQPDEGLSAEHYEILDEVFEIIRRLQRHNMHQYRHGLFKTFLRQQCVFQLKNLLGDTDIDEALSDFYRLLLDIIMVQIEAFDPSLLYKPEDLDLLYTLQRSYIEVSKVASEYRQSFDENYATGLVMLAESFLQTNYLDKAQGMFDKAFGIVSADRNRHLTKLKSRILLGSAECAYRRDEFDRAVLLLSTASGFPYGWRVYHDSFDGFYEYDLLKNRVMRNMADMLLEMGWKDDAIEQLEYCLEAYKYAENKSFTHQWNEAMALCHIALGKSKACKGDKNIAIQHYRNALDHINAIGTVNKGKFYTLIGKLLIIVNEDFNANEFIDNAEVKISKALGCFKSRYEVSPERQVKPYIEFLISTIDYYKSRDNESLANRLYKEAHSILETLYKKSPEVWRTQYLFLLLRHDIKRALPLMEDAYKRNPLYFAPHYTLLLQQLIECAEVKGDVEAVQLYTEVISEIVYMLFDEDCQTNEVIYQQLLPVVHPLNVCRGISLGFTPQYQRAIFSLVEIYHFYEQYDVAEKLLKAGAAKTCKLNEENPTAWANAHCEMELKLAENATLSGQPDKAIEYKMSALHHCCGKSLPLTTKLERASEVIEYLKDKERHEALLEILELTTEIYLIACRDDIESHWTSCIDAFEAVGEQCKKMGDHIRAKRIETGARKLRKDIIQAFQNEPEEAQFFLNHQDVRDWEKCLIIDEEFKLISEADVKGSEPSKKCGYELVDERVDDNRPGDEDAWFYELDLEYEGESEDIIF